MSATVISLPLRRRMLTPKERTEALLLAALNDDYALLCAPEQASWRKLFEVNAKLLRKLAT